MALICKLTFFALRIRVLAGHLSFSICKLVIFTVEGATNYLGRFLEGTAFSSLPTEICIGKIMIASEQFLKI
jgi:hypothetical protein